MADSYRLAVLKKLTDHLKGITKANGYDYDMADKVFRGRTVFGQNDPSHLLSILEAPRGDSGMFAGENKFERKENWGLLIQGWASDDVDNPTDPLYGLMDAVEDRLLRLIAVSNDSGNPIYPNEYLLQRSIGDIEIAPGIVRPPMENVSSKAFFYLPVRVTLVRTHG